MNRVCQTMRTGTVRIWPYPEGMGIDWNAHLVDQLDWHWQAQLRPRLDGLTDDEYFREPVAGSWSVRRRAGGQPPQAPRPAGGAGEHRRAGAAPPPGPPDP